MLFIAVLAGNKEMQLPSMITGCRPGVPIKGRQLLQSNTCPW